MWQYRMNQLKDYSIYMKFEIFNELSDLSKNNKKIEILYSADI